MSSNSCFYNNILMDKSVITPLTLSGLNETANYRILLFASTLLCYGVIWLVNVTIIVAIVVDKRLHEPMYIFICNLCINGLYGTAGFFPKFLKDLLSTSHVISFAGCLMQSFVLSTSACAEFSILVLIACDRYMAICRPLVYHSVMTRQRVCVFVFGAWFFPFYVVVMVTISTSTSKLCSYHIPKIYCNNWLIGKLRCSDSVAGTRLEAMELPQAAKNFIAMEFLIIPPVLNPLMYGFKLTRIRNKIKNVMCRKSCKPRLQPLF
ncbi:olfactory receptor 6E1-like [Aulostomus maculatus]